MELDKKSGPGLFSSTGRSVPTKSGPSSVSSGVQRFFPHKGAFCLNGGRFSGWKELAGGATHL